MSLSSSSIIEDVASLVETYNYDDVSCADLFSDEKNILPFEKETNGIPLGNRVSRDYESDDDDDDDSSDCKKSFNEIEFNKNINYNDNEVDLDCESLLGLFDVHRMMFNVIGKQYLYPEVYSSSDLTMYDKSMAISGRTGTGKKTAVKAFCKRYGICLIIVNWMYPQKDIQALVDYASSNQPCVLYFDHCDHFFRDSPFVNVGNDFMYFYKKKVLEEFDQIWLVFGLNCTSNELIPFYRDKIGTKVVQIHPLSKNNRRILFYRFLKSKYIKFGHCNFTNVELDNLINLLVGASDSEHFTPLKIKDTCNKIFINRINKLGASQMTESMKSSVFLPTKEDFLSNTNSVQGKRRLNKSISGMSNSTWNLNKLSMPNSAESLLKRKRGTSSSSSSSSMSNGKPLNNPGSPSMSLIQNISKRRKTITT